MYAKRNAFDKNLISHSFINSFTFSIGNVMNFQFQKYTNDKYRENDKNFKQIYFSISRSEKKIIIIAEVNSGNVYVVHQKYILYMREIYINNDNNNSSNNENKSPSLSSVCIKFYLYDSLCVVRNRYGILCCVVLCG